MKTKKKRPEEKRPPHGAPPANDREALTAASRALVGRDAEAREMRPVREDASVEDPLEDWPED